MDLHTHRKSTYLQGRNKLYELVAPVALLRVNLCWGEIGVGTTQQKPDIVATTDRRKGARVGRRTI